MFNSVELIGTNMPDEAWGIFVSIVVTRTLALLALTCLEEGGSSGTKYSAQLSLTVLNAVQQLR